MKKIILILLSLLLVSTLIDAQTRNFGLDPKEDSLFIAQMREKMAKIRETRPTIALVLSGGGAKGAAHIGVIDYIEKLGIPIDMVLGTSMGGLVGGLYAVGYSPEQLETIITGIDWGWALSDKVSRDKIAYSEKKYKEKFLISLPFFYDKRVFQEKKNQDLKFTDWIQQQEDIQWGASDDSPNQIMDNIKGSLPFGFVVGQNVNNTISSLTVGYQDEIDFSELPIPFICVATEMVGSNAKVWYKGKLNTALRSTMSIPGLFSPIKKDGMVLVDGGMRNNYPVDIAKYLGADFVIGVDLSEGYINYASMNNVFDLFMQAIDMLGREAYEKNKNLADITIKPDITGYNMMSFDKASINTLMQRGWEGAEANSSDLRILKDLFNKDTLTLNNRPAINLLEEKISISQITINGVTDRESRYLMELAGLNIRNRQGKKDIEDAVAKIFGTKSFDYVTYELLGETEPFRLVINCTKGPIHQFGASYRFDTEEVVSALLNLGLNTHRLQGSALDLTGKVSINPMADIHYYYKLPTGPAINYNFHYKLQNNNLFDVSHIKFKASFHNLRNEIWLSNLNWKSFDVKFGAMHDFYSIYSVLSNSDFKDYTLDKQGHNFISFFANASADTFDNGYFPTKGSKMKINYQWGIAGLNSTLDPFHIVSINYKGVAKKGKIFTILPSIDLRLILNSAVPLEYANIIGGTLAGRYLDQQIPFIGINNAAILPPLLGQAGLDFRVNFAKNNYITATAQGGITGATMDEIFTKSRTTFAGFGLEYAYNSFLGPLKMNVHWSTFTHKVGAYVGLGFDF